MHPYLAQKLFEARQEDLARESVSRRIPSTAVKRSLRTRAGLSLVGLGLRMADPVTVPLLAAPLRARH